MTAPARLDFDAVAATLRETQAAFAQHRDELWRDPMDDDVVANMLAGYRFVDALVAESVDLFALGQSKALLELNTRVLCGTDPDRRLRFATHLAATERRFYDEPDGGVQDVIEWYAMHAGESVWYRAAGLYVRMLAWPQLFVEGNHRTGALVMSYILLREGRPPFVLTAADAPEFFEVGASVRTLERNSPTLLIRMPRVKRRLALLLVSQVDRRHLRI